MGFNPHNALQVRYLTHKNIMLINHIECQIYKKFPYPPTEEQKNIIFSLSKFICSPSHDSAFVLNGYAGTGKTSIISALVKALEDLEISVLLLAPTGRAAKVMQQYSGRQTYTIHRKIYLKSLAGGLYRYQLTYKRPKNTIVIVDEISMISDIDYEGSLFGSGNLLADLMEYVLTGDQNKIILVGDSAQLPPVGLDTSPALDPLVLGAYATVNMHYMKEVVRQAQDSGILVNATNVRMFIEGARNDDLQMVCSGDVKRIENSDLIDSLESSFSRHKDSTVIITRSNKRALRFNLGIRKSIFDFDSELESGDKLMVIKNNYSDSDVKRPFEFIANGDVIVVKRIMKIVEKYNFRFAYVTYEMPDYDDYVDEGWLLLDTLYSDSAGLSRDRSNELFNNIFEGYAHVTGKNFRTKRVMEDEYYNALQVKFAYAVTCHKAQGGQWSEVYVDTPVFGDEPLTLDLQRWVYTALTRATDRLYLTNWPSVFFDGDQ